MNESKVVRYAVDYASEDGMKVSDYGNWVTHADYRALEEELAALRGKVGELKASLQHIADRHSEKSVDGQIVRTALKLVA